MRVFQGGAKRPYSNGYDDIANDSGICSDSQNKVTALFRSL